MKQTFDAVIVGAGQAGPFLAARFAESGRRVALVERKFLGGTCVNAGCTPTKAMVASARIAFQARCGNDFGVHVDSVRVNLRKVRDRAHQIVLQSRNGQEKWLRNIANLTLLKGTASFESAHTLRVGDAVLEAPQIFLNVGARPAIPDLRGIDSVPYLTSTSILEMGDLPAHLIVIGGGYVGLEFAQMFHRFGSRVTIVDKNSRLASREDEDASNVVHQVFRAEGIDIRLNATCIHFEGRGGEVLAGLECNEGVPHIIGSHVLLAVGRRPNTDDLNLPAAGVAVDGAGFIAVDDELRASAEGIYALGDCNGRGAFTHTSYNDFEIVADNLVAGASRHISDRISARALYIDPPLAQVGMTEEEVRKSRLPALIGVRPMTRVSRALEKGETFGFIKVLVHAESRQILGAALFGTGADEAVHCLLTAMYAKQPASLFAHAMHIHPTVAELIPTIMGELRPLE